MLIDKSYLDLVLQKTIESVEKSQEEIYQFSENVRQEYGRLQRELVDIKEQIKAVIKKVDQLEKEFAAARYRLMEVNRNFNKYSEEQVKAVYDTAYKKQLELMALKEQEKLLRMQRDHLERYLKNLEETLQLSAELISNMNIALCFIRNDLGEIRTKISELQQIQKLGLSIILAREEERKHLAREIHDGPAQSMANIVMRAEFCIKLLETQPKMLRSELVSLIDLAKQCLKDVRKIIFELRPMQLDDLGLVPALKRYIEQYQKDCNILVEMTVLGKERRFDSTLEIALFRIVQECLTNVKKHAQAKHVAIIVEFLENKINLSVKDDGIGFDYEQVSKEKHNNGYGLLGIKERLQLIKGELTVKTAPGRGTELIFFVPVSDI